MEYRTQDEGLLWRRESLFAGFGAFGYVAAEGDQYTIPLTLSAKGSARMVLYSADHYFHGISMNRVRINDDIDANWGPPATVVDTPPGNHYSGCNVDFIDRALSIGRAPGSADAPNVIRLRASAFRGGDDPEGGGWIPTEASNLLSGNMYTTANLACSNINGLERFFLLASTAQNHLLVGRADHVEPFLEGADPKAMHPVSVTGNPLVADPASLPAPMVVGNYLYVAYRDDHGNLRVARAQAAAVGEAGEQWQSHSLTDDGDAGFNPVVAGHGGDGLLVAYTNSSGNELSLTRSALLAPELIAEVRQDVARLTWAPVPGAVSYQVGVGDESCANESMSTFAGTNVQIDGLGCVRATARDELGYPGMASASWLLAPFERSSSALESGALAGSSVSTGMARIGQNVALLSAQTTESRFFLSTNGGSTFANSVLVVSSAVEYQDIAMTEVAGSVYVHVIYKLAAGGGLVYRRYDITSRNTPVSTDPFITPVANASLGRHVRLFAKGSTVAVAYVDEVNDRVWFRRNDNNGASASWLTAVTVATHSEATNWGSARVVDIEGTGVAVAFSFEGTGLSYVFQGTSTDSGASFSGTAVCTATSKCNPRYITSAVHSKYLAIASTNASELLSGTVRLSIIGKGTGSGPGAAQAEAIWANITLEGEQDALQFRSLDIAANDDGLWAVYSTCSDLGLAASWRLRLAYCGEDCHSAEAWSTSTVVHETSPQDNCSRNWFEGLALNVDSASKETIIVYTEHPLSGSRQRRLLSGGYIMAK